MEITRHGDPYQTNGEPPAIGSALPNFNVTAATGEALDTSALNGRYTLISVVPDINTRVCSVSTKRFNQAVDAFDAINFYTVSTNTRAEQQDWCAAEGVTQMQLVADSAGDFGRAMGLYVDASHTDARSVWITDPSGVVVYREVITEQTDEPDYTSALAYLEGHAR